jgi:hypothetical protein
MILLVGVYAYGTSNPSVFGHSAEEIEIKLGDGSTMNLNAQINLLNNRIAEAVNESVILEMFPVCGEGSALTKSGDGGFKCVSIPEQIQSPNYLVFNQHTEAQCTGLSGSVVSDPKGKKFCKFSLDTCPVGWAQYNSWSETTAKTCEGRCGRNCKTKNHNFANIAQEKCTYTLRTPDGSSWGFERCMISTCTAPISKIGCY